MRLIGIGLIVLALALLVVAGLGLHRPNTFNKSEALPISSTRPQTGMPELVLRLSDEFSRTGRIEPARNALAEYTLSEQVSGFSSAFVTAYGGVDNQGMDKIGKLARKLNESWDSIAVGSELHRLMQQCIDAAPHPKKCAGLITFTMYAGIPRKSWCDGDLTAVMSCRDWGD